MTNTSGQKEFEDTKVVIIIRISRKNRQHKGQKKKYYLFLAILRGAWPSKECISCNLL